MNHHGYLFCTALTTPNLLLLSRVFQTQTPRSIEPLGQMLELGKGQSNEMNTLYCKPGIVETIENKENTETKLKAPVSISQACL